MKSSAARERAVRIPSLKQVQHLGPNQTGPGLQASQSLKHQVVLLARPLGVSAMEVITSSSRPKQDGFIERQRLPPVDY
jgi:hypothetical protein